MDIKLPINPKVRKAIEKELDSPTPVIVKPLMGGGREDFDTKLPVINGFYDDRAFDRHVGAAFILNYQLFEQGLLTDEQADKLLHDALLGLRAAHLKVIHPKLDVDGMIRRLANDRFEKTRDQKLKDLLARKLDPLWQPAGEGTNGSELARQRVFSSFDLLKSYLVEMATQDFPMAVALGMSKDAALKHLSELISDSLNALEITDERCPHIRAGFLHHFLIAYPDLWNQTNTEPYHFLGELMVHMMPGNGMAADKAVVDGQAGKSLIRHPGGIPLELIEFTLDYLVSIDPDVLDARHLLREGTRSAVWLDRCPNLEQGLPTLERLLSYGVWHPALERLDSSGGAVWGALSEAGRRDAILCYAKEPGIVPRPIAKCIVDTDPHAYDQALDQLKKFPSIQRLTDLKWPSDEQMLKLSPKNKRLLLEGDLGI